MKQKSKKMYVGAIVLLVLILGSVMATAPVLKESRETKPAPELEIVLSEEIEEHEIVLPIEIPPVLRTFSLKINPSEKITNNGVASYDVVVKDLHKIPECIDYDHMACAIGILGIYEYNLDYEIETSEVRIVFSEDNFSLKHGEEKTVKMTVYAKHKGLHEFKITATSVNDGDKEISKKGVLLYKQEPTPIQTVLFQGEGYLLSSDNSNFHFVELEILKQRSSLSGTFELMGIGMEIDGRISGGMGSSEGYSIHFIEFDVIYMNHVVGSFDGEVKKSGTLSILDGTFQGNIGNEWRLIGFN